MPNSTSMRPRFITRHSSDCLLFPFSSSRPTEYGVATPAIKKKQRENEVICMKAIPCRVCKLVTECTPERRGRATSFVHGVHNFFRAHDPKHIKAAKCVERIQSLGRGRGCSNSILVHIASVIAKDNMCCYNIYIFFVNGLLNKNGLWLCHSLLHSVRYSAKGADSITACGCST